LLGCGCFYLEVEVALLNNFGSAYGLLKRNHFGGDLRLGRATTHEYEKAQQHASQPSVHRFEPIPPAAICLRECYCPAVSAAMTGSGEAGAPSCCRTPAKGFPTESTTRIEAAHSPLPWVSL